MKISNWNIFLLVLMVWISGCKKKDEEIVPNIHQESGAIFVTVLFLGEPVANATVTTDHETPGASTSTLGKVLMENISPGIYQVFATKDGWGSGSGAVDVNPGDVAEVVINLIPGVYEGLKVDIIPDFTQNRYVGEPVDVLAVVHDSVDDDEDIDFEWSTDLDGVISTVGVGNNGIATLDYAFDTPGERTITVTVTNSEGDTDSDQLVLNIVALPEAVVLESIEAQGNSLHLNWSQAEGNPINYRVYREGESGFEVIAYISDLNTTSYIDNDVTIGIEYKYQIGQYFGNNLEIMSNIETGMLDGEFIDIGTGLDMMLHDPNNPIIYGLDTDNNSLLFINTEQQEVVNTIYVGSFPTDMDFSLDNQLLYIANSGSTEITVVDIASQSVQSTFFAESNIGTWDGNPYTLAVLTNGLLACAREESFANIQLIDITSGSHVFTEDENIYQPYLLANSDGTKLFLGESGLSGSQLLSYSLIDNELVWQATSPNFSYQPRKLLMTENDEFIFYGAIKFQTSGSLGQLGTFDSDIVAINSDGSRAIGDQEVYNGFDYNAVMEIPLSTTVAVFGNDDQTAYLFQNETNKLYIITVE